MKPYIRISCILLQVLLLAGCMEQLAKIIAPGATVESMEQKALPSSFLYTYNVESQVLVDAARFGLRETGFTIKKEIQVDEQNYRLIAELPPGGTGWGQIARVVVRHDPNRSRLSSYDYIAEAVVSHNIEYVDTIELKLHFLIRDYVVREQHQLQSLAIGAGKPVEKKFSRGLKGMFSKAYMRKENYLDIRPHLNLHATILGEYATRTRWQTEVRSQEIEDVYLGPEGRLLASLIDLTPADKNTNFFSPFNGPFVMFDAENGNKLWEVPRTPNYDISYAVHMVAPWFVYSERNRDQVKLVSVDANTGEMLWSHKYPHPLVLTVDDLRGRIYAMDVQESQGVLYAIDIRDGKEHWQASKPAWAATREMFIDRDDLIINAESLVVVDTASGSERLEVTLGATSVENAIIVLKDGYLVPEWDEVNLYNREGQRQWGYKLGGVVVNLASFGDRFYVVVSAEGGKNIVHALSRTRGKRLWSYSATGRIKSTLESSNGRLFFTAENHLFVLSDTSGELLRRIELPAGQAEQDRPTDHLIVRKGNIIVGGATGISAYSVKTLKNAWAYQFQGTDRYKVPAVNGGTDYGKEVLGDINKNSAESGYDFVDAFANLNGTDYGVQRAVQRMHAVNRDTASKITSADAEVRADAYRARSIAASHVQNTKMINDSINRATASVGMAISTYYAKDRIEQKAKRGAVAAYYQRRDALNRTLERTFSQAMQARYFVRPVLADNGGALMLVDLDNGMWAEVIVAPPEGYLADEVYANTRAFTFADDIKTLYVNGIGLDPSRWTPDSRNIWQSVNRSLIAYDLDNLKLRSPEQYPALSVVLSQRE